MNLILNDMVEVFDKKDDNLYEDLIFDLCSVWISFADRCLFQWRIYIHITYYITSFIAAAARKLIVFINEN